MTRDYRLTDEQAEALRMALVRALVASEQYAQRCPPGPRRKGYQAQLESIYDLVAALNPQMPAGLDDLAFRPRGGWRRRRAALH